MERHAMFRAAPPFDEMDNSTTLGITGNNVVAYVAAMHDAPVTTQIQFIAGYAVPPMAAHTVSSKQWRNIPRERDH